MPSTIISSNNKGWDVNIKKNSEQIVYKQQVNYFFNICVILFAKQKKAIPSFLKKKLIFKNYCKSIVVPLTAGSGSEATSFAVVYYKKKKFSVESKQLLTKNNLKPTGWTKIS